MRYTYTIVEMARGDDLEARGKGRAWADEFAGRWVGAPFVLVTRKAWSPPTDVYETTTEIVVKMEIAGLKNEHLQIIIADDVLSISGRRHDDAEGRKIGYHQVGISYGEFAIDIRLPGPVHHDAISAEYEAGFLRVSLPKAQPQENRPVRIQINEHPA